MCPPKNNRVDAGTRRISRPRFPSWLDSVRGIPLIELTYRGIEAGPFDRERNGDGTIAIIESKVLAARAPKGEKAKRAPPHQLRNKRERSWRSTGWEVGTHLFLLFFPGRVQKTFPLPLLLRLHVSVPVSFHVVHPSADISRSFKT